MKRHILFLIASLGFINYSFGQQDPLYSQYILNPMSINPAYAGLNNNFAANLSYRSQWGGFDGNPTTVNLNGHISLVENRVGAGLMVVQDEIGNTKNLDINVIGSYRLQLEDKVVSFGMQAGLSNIREDNTKINLPDNQRNDPAFMNNLNTSKPNIGAGVAMKSEKFFIGLSVPRLLGSSFTGIDGEKFDLYNQHYYLFGSYVFTMGTRLRLKPAVLFKSVKGSPLSTDLNFNLNIDQLYQAGVFTRNFNTYGIQLQALVKDQFRFGYTFELPTANSVGTNFNTHEIMVGIKLSLFNFHDRSVSNF